MRNAEHIVFVISFVAKHESNRSKVILVASQTIVLNIKSTRIKNVSSFNLSKGGYVLPTWSCGSETQIQVDR